MKVGLAFALVCALSGVPAPAAATVGSCPQYEKAFARHHLPVKLFSRIAYRESRCNPKSVSKIRVTGYPDVGLVQIQGSWRTVTYRVCRLKASANHLQALTKIDCNLAVASYLWEHGGKNHWRGSSRQSN